MGMHVERSFLGSMFHLENRNAEESSVFIFYLPESYIPLGPLLGITGFMCFGNIILLLRIEL
jgi:hypothetical protein